MTDGTKADDEKKRAISAPVMKPAPTTEPIIAAAMPAVDKKTPFMLYLYERRGRFILYL